MEADHGFAVLHTLNCPSCDGAGAYIAEDVDEGTFAFCCPHCHLHVDGASDAGAALTRARRMAHMRSRQGMGAQERRHDDV